MTGALRRLGSILGIGFRADRRMAALAFGLTVVASVAGPLVSLWFSSFIDAAAAGDRSSAVTSAVVLSILWVASIVAAGVLDIRLVGVEVRIIRLVYADLIRLSGRVPTIEMHERPDIADRIDLVRRDVESFGFAMSAIVWAFGIVIRLTTSVVVLLSVSPLLIALPLLGIPSLIAGDERNERGQRIREEMTEDRRLSEHLFALGTTPGPGKEFRIFGLISELPGGTARCGTVCRCGSGGPRSGDARDHVRLAGVRRRVRRGDRVRDDPGHRRRATVGDVALVVTISEQIRGELGGAVGLIGWLLQIGEPHHYHWIREYAEAAADRRQASAPTPDRLSQGIRLEGVSFRYPGTDVEVLRASISRSRPGPRSRSSA